jgi:hypothetical protein
LSKEIRGCKETTKNESVQRLFSWNRKKKVITFVKIKITTKILLPHKDMSTSMGHVHNLMKYTS